MAKRKVSPEGKIIALFTGLSEESQRMVMFGLNAIMSQVQPAPKSVQPATTRKKKGPTLLPDDPDDFGRTVGAA
jgi:hypothetical protein